MKPHHKPVIPISSGEGEPPDTPPERPEAQRVDEHSALLLGTLANLQFQQRDYTAAADSYRKILQVDPGDYSARLNLGICLEKTNQWAAALEEFGRVLEMEPHRDEAQVGSGICLLHLKREREALEIFDSVLAVRPSDQVALVGRSVALQMLGRQKEASDAMTALSRQSPGLANLSSAARMGAGPRLSPVPPANQPEEEKAAAQALSVGDYRAVIRHCSRLVQQQPSHFEAWLNLGVARQKVGETEDAVFAYHQALRLRPNAPEPHLNLGMLKQATGDSAGAEDAYRHALQLAPRNEAALWNYGLLLERSDRPEEAERQYVKLLEANPAWAEPRFRLGFLLLQREAFTEAARAFESCIEWRSNWPEARLNLGIARYRLGELSDALRHFEAVVASEPGLAEAWRGIAAVSVDREDWAGARNAYDNLHKLGAPCPELCYNLAIRADAKEQTADAERFYREAIRQQPVFPQALLDLGHLLHRLGRAPEAGQVWRRAMEFDPSLAAECEPK